MPTNNMTPQEFWRSVLEEVPEASFHSFSDRFGSSPNQKNLIRNSFRDIQNIFLGNLGKMAREGVTPSGSFTNFLEDFDFNNFYRSQPLSARGNSQSLFAPPVRFLNF